MNLRFLQRYFIALLGLKFLAATVAILLPLNIPHVWRQIDTLSVGYRYWLRWGHGSDAHPLWPAVLNSGDYFGYMGMEFPFLNILIAPLFAFGPEHGTKLSLFVIFILNIALWIVAIKTWDHITIAGIEVSKALLWLPLFGIAAPLFSRMIPDTPAMLMCLISSGLIWKGERRHLVLALLLGTLGMLIKPPVCVTFGLILLKPGTFRDRLHASVIPALGVIITVAYYVICVPYLDALEPGNKLFATNFRSPLTSYLEYFQHPLKIADLLETGLFFPGFIIGMLLIVASKVRSPKLTALGPLAGIWLLQFVTIIGLDGEHSFVHSYYYSGLAPTSALLVVGLLTISDQDERAAKMSRLGTAILCLGILVFQISSAHFNLRTITFLGGKPPPAERMPAFSECRDLKKKAPQIPWGTDFTFRTEDHLYPKLGLCFGERTGSKKSRYGLYYVNEVLPDDCTALVQSEHLQIVECEPQDFRD